MNIGIVYRSTPYCNIYSTQLIQQAFSPDNRVEAGAKVPLAKRTERHPWTWNQIAVLASFTKSSMPKIKIEKKHMELWCKNLSDASLA